MDILRIQEALRRQGLDGWLFFDHHERDPLAYRVLGFHPLRHVTMRFPERSSSIQVGRNNTTNSASC
jgi:hypothetical protein